MAIHPSILAWRIPWTEEPGKLRSMGITRVGHDLATNQTKQNKYLKSFEISMEFGTDKKYR